VTPLLTAREVAERLGLSPATILDWHEAGKLPSFRLGGATGGPVRFRWEEVEMVLESWRCGPLPGAHGTHGTHGALGIVE